MTWNVMFYNDKGKYLTTLKVVKEIEINSSVENLVDTATITLPEAQLNRVFEIEKQIARGTGVKIWLGYDNANVLEFKGYVREITTNGSSLKIECEDALFVFRKAVKDVELKPTSVKKIAQNITQQIVPSYKVICNEFDLDYEKFVIHQATAYDVLKKLQEETKANIYFDTDKKELHIHPPYIEKGGEVVYSPHYNLRGTSLEYKKAVDRKVEITVESVGRDGKVKSYKTGTTGGDSVTIKTGTLSQDAIKKVADAELRKRSADGFEGSVDTYLVPMVKPTYTAIYVDTDYPSQKGSYYIISVKTNFSENGGKRTIQLGTKLSV